MGEEIGFSEEVVEVEADRRHIDVWLYMNMILLNTKMKISASAKRMY